MSNRVEPVVKLVDFSTVRQNVERKIRRRRSRSTPSASLISEHIEKHGAVEQSGEPEIGNNDSSTYKTNHLAEQIVNVNEIENLATEATPRKETNGYHNGAEESHYISKKIKEQTKIKKSSKVLPTVFKFNSTQKAASKWKDLASNKRFTNKILKQFEFQNLKKLIDGGYKQGNIISSDNFGFLEDEIDNSEYFNENDRTGLKSSINEEENSNVNSKKLIRYFISLAKVKEENKNVDLDFVESLIREGADPNLGDKYGQTVLHEVARIWHPDVAQFLLEHGSKVDIVDHFGRSPLHVAAAVDFSEMVEFLLSKGSNIHQRTHGEEQTPIHYAAKNDACNSLATLIGNGASMEDRDFKDRTPLQLGAELDRSEACKLLLREGAPAGVWDDSGMSCMNLMIQKMPPVALEALDQFHIKDRANRKQYFYLNFLEPPMLTIPTGSKSSLKVAVEEQQFAIVMHPVMQRITEVKWNWFGKMGACVFFSLNLLFCIMWTGLICILPTDRKDLYDPLSKKAFRIVLEISVVCVLFFWMISEYMEYRNSIRERDNFIRWREDELIRDLKYCHPRWPEERAYIEREIAELTDLKPSYLVDWWNYFDWFTYGFIFATIICHIVTLVDKSQRSFNAEKAIGSVMLVLQWTRLLKFVRAFQPLGPFVVILRHVISDTARFAFLFFIFYIPYAASLWVLFGKKSVKGYTDIEELMYNLLQITVVGDFNFEDLSTTDGRMARLLCGTYIVISGIVCLNMFIALLSDTFQRVYDNAKANAQMLRASRVLNFEDNFSSKRQEKFRRRIHKQCSPEVSYYDDDMSDPSDTELKRMTHQIKQEIDDMKKYLNGKFGNIEEDTPDSNHKSHHSRGYMNAENLKVLEQEVGLLKSNYEHSMKIMNMQMTSINAMLAELLAKKKKRQSSKRGKGSTGADRVLEDRGQSNVVAVAPISFDKDESQA